MKNTRKFTALFLISLVTMILSACGAASDQESSENDGTAEGNEGNGNEVYTLRAATAQEQDIVQYAGFDAFREIVEEKSGGRIEIVNAGGPESIPGYNQGEAVMNRTIDMSWIPTGYYTELVPESLVSSATELSYDELLDRGSLDYLSETYEEKMNAKILGSAGKGKFAFFTRDKEINSMADFTGMQIRAHSVYTPLLEELGNDVINMEGSEIYSALQRSMIDGFAWAEYGVTDMAMEEVIDTKITPTFGDMAIYILINMDAWGELPEDLQEIMKEAAIESYYVQEEMVDQKIEEEEEILQENGVDIVELEDGEEYVQTYQDELWEWLENEVGDVEHYEEYFRE